MFTAVSHKNLADAESYFDEHLAQNDYYAAGEIRPGQWIGVGAERLGLTNAVTREQFHALCENRNPNDDERLTQRQQKENQRRVFFDFTCAPPKSVSVLAVTLDDQRLVEAHEESARVAFRELETFAATRVRKRGSQRDCTTGNLVAAAFVHDSSRELDPQLHTHFTVFNATFDKEERCWKALQAGGMYDAIRYGTAVYRNELAKRVQQIGYRIQAAKHGFEIEGVNPEILNRFSKRAQQRDAVVQAMEQKLGRTLTNDEISHAVHQSRAKKLKGISSAEVRERQLAQLQPDEFQALQKLTASAQHTGLPHIAGLETQALNHAITHLFERKSVVPEHELLTTALAHRQGEVDLASLKQEVKYSSELVKTERGLSTHRILATELALIQTVNAGCDAVAPLHPGYRPADWLGEDQQRAIYHVLRTSDRITGLRGLAGSGKTTALRELVAACNEAKIEPLFCAPTAAATDVLRKEGFEAKTLQSLLLTKPVLSVRQLVVLDEAGAVGMDDMKRLFDLARDARIVLSGDTGQHASVARGDALRILENHSDFKSGQLTRIRRQRKAAYRMAVELAAKKQTVEAFAQLERMGAVVESSKNDLHDKAAQAYLKASVNNQSALLVAPTWNEIEAVTEKVRAALKTSGRLTGEEKEFQVFDSLSWTEAQKRDARQYRPGMAIHFHRRTAGFAKDETVAVVAIENDALKVQRADSSESIFPLGQGSALFDVGEKRKFKIAAGDKLLLQANAARRRFINDELVEVLAIQGDSVVLADGRVIPQNYRTFTHGYAVTSHAAQGKTVDEVLPVSALSRDIEDQIDDMQRVIGAKAHPEIQIGPHCDNPYTCPLHERCWSFLPEASVFTLYRGGQKGFSLLKQGIQKLADIPADVALTDNQAIQLAAVLGGQPHIDRPALAAFLRQLEYPVSFLDFETFGTAIPLFDGVSPYQQVPFQYSLHIVRTPNGRMEHFQFLAEGRGDPRPKFMRQLQETLPPTGSVVTYNASFETSRLKECCELLPEFKPWFKRVTPRTVDLLLPFRGFRYYHPDQHGSASMKAVLPALTGQGYENLAIQEGGAASREFLRVTYGEVPDAERHRVRQDLQEYCGLDTLGMVQIVNQLKRLTA